MMLTMIKTWRLDFVDDDATISMMIKFRADDDVVGDLVNNESHHANIDDNV